MWIRPFEGLDGPFESRGLIHCEHSCGVMGQRQPQPREKNNMRSFGSSVLPLFHHNAHSAGILHARKRSPITLPGGGEHTEVRTLLRVSTRRLRAHRGTIPQPRDLNS
jgi:hypothetical protein